ncbi:peptide/nitrate transporter [Acrasis kona]|uniref:Peptide/nitrate transporter n=1 Tax=Acrasis kona TaxID=1008807 RepID=A0AAW2ZEN0_9EUKA
MEQIMSLIRGFMIADFNIVEDQDERKIGYYAGLLGSSYYCTQLFAAFIWGYMSDRIGRRPVILIGITGSCITSLLFGFSTNIYWAIGTRMLLGALNGNVGVCKTYIGEVTDKTNQAKAFSYVGMSFSTSLIAGPLIGGFLSRPVTQYPNLFKQDGIIKQFLTRRASESCGVHIVCDWFCDCIHFYQGNKQAKLIESTEDHTQDAEVTLDNELAHPPSIHVDQLKEITQEQELTEMEQNTFKIGSRTFTFPKWWPKNEITTTRAPLLTCFIYSLLGLVTISFQEVIPLWSLLPLSQKGLGFDPSKIGILGLVSGFVIGFLQIALMARILKKFGAMWAFRIASLIVVPFFPFYPEISYLGGSSVLLWAVLIVVFFIRFSCTECMYTCMNLMMNNSVTSVSRGKLNGLAMSLISLMRAIGPAGGAALFSLSNFLPFPFDVHLMFILFSVSFTIIFCISLALPKTINEPKISK